MGIRYVGTCLVTEQRITGIGWLTHISRQRGEAELWLKEHYPEPPALSESATEPSSRSDSASSA